MSKTEIEILLKEFSERPIAYHPVYVKITGSLTAGVLLSQLVYWHYRMDEKEFYKIDKEFCDALSIGFDEFRAAKKRLNRMGFVRIHLKGVPPRTHYTTNIKAIIEAMVSISNLGKFPNSICGNSTNQFGEKAQIIKEHRLHTESTIIDPPHTPPKTGGNDASAKTFKGKDDFNQNGEVEQLLDRMAEEFPQSLAYKPLWCKAIRKLGVGPVELEFAETRAAVREDRIKEDGGKYLTTLLKNKLASANYEEDSLQGDHYET